MYVLNIKDRDLAKKGLIDIFRLHESSQVPTVGSSLFSIDVGANLDLPNGVPVSCIANFTAIRYPDRIGITRTTDRRASITCKKYLSGKTIHGRETLSDPEIIEDLFAEALLSHPNAGSLLQTWLQVVFLGLSKDKPQPGTVGLFHVGHQKNKCVAVHMNGDDSTTYQIGSQTYFTLDDFISALLAEFGMEVVKTDNVQYLALGDLAVAFDEILRWALKNREKPFEPHIWVGSSQKDSTSLREPDIWIFRIIGNFGQVNIPNPNRCYMSDPDDTHRLAGAITRAASATVKAIEEFLLVSNYELTHSAAQELERIRALAK